MFWTSTNQKTEETEISVEHIDGIILGSGGYYRWGEEHPMSWETITQAVNRLYEMFEELGWVGSTSGSTVMQVKEKFGSIRVYSYIEDNDKETYLNCFRKLMEEYPGIERYLEPENVENSIVFSGTEEESCSFRERNKEAETVKELQ